MGSMIDPWPRGILPNTQVPVVTGCSLAVEKVNAYYCFIYKKVVKKTAGRELRPRGLPVTRQWCGRVQATSYCDTLFGFFEFWGCSPA